MPRMQNLKTSDGEWTEFQMNVPWGHFSGKWWGSHDVRPIILIHGWQDNSGTFDTLIPLLPKHLSYLAIDLPGHGLSSHFPAGVMSHKIDYVNVLLRIVEVMKWDKVSLIGHSMGGHTALWFAAMFPQKVDLFVMLDALKSPDFKPELFWEVYGAMIDRTVAIDERKQSEDEPPCYTYEECLNRYYDGAYKSIDKDKCSYILARNLKESSKNPGTFYFSRDPRLRMMNENIIPLNYYELLAVKIRIPVMYINAQLSPTLTSDFEGRMHVLRKNPLFECVDIDGRHHVHLNEPEKLSGSISKFLIKYSSCAGKKGKL